MHEKQCVHMAAISKESSPHGCNQQIVIITWLLFGHHCALPLPPGRGGAGPVKALPPNGTAQRPPHTLVGIAWCPAPTYACYTLIFRHSCLVVEFPERPPLAHSPLSLTSVNCTSWWRLNLAAHVAECGLEARYSGRDPPDASSSSPRAMGLATTCSFCPKRRVSSSQRGSRGEGRRGVYFDSSRVVRATGAELEGWVAQAEQLSSHDASWEVWRTRMQESESGY